MAARVFEERGRCRKATFEPARGRKRISELTD